MVTHEPLDSLAVTHDALLLQLSMDPGAALGCIARLMDLPDRFCQAVILDLPARWLALAPSVIPAGRNRQDLAQAHDWILVPMHGYELILLELGRAKMRNVFFMISRSWRKISFSRRS